VAFSLAACSESLFSLLPTSVHGLMAPFTFLLLGALTVLNLRGVRESVAIVSPIFLLFVVSHVVALGVGIAAAWGQVPRELAYLQHQSAASVSQIGYITLGIGIANKPGLTGSIVHLVNHAMMKGALFLALGAVVYRIGSARLSDLAGIGRRMPWTMTAFTIAGFGLIGTPGTVGFISKWYLVAGAFAAGQWVLVFLIVGSSLLALVYVGRAVEVIWFRDTGPAAARATDGCSSRRVSTSPSSMRKPRTLTWWSRRPRYSREPSPVRRVRSPVR